MPGEVEAVGEDRDGPDAAEAQPGGGLEVEGRVAPEAHPLVQGDRGRHEPAGVQAEDGRPGGLGQPAAGLDQGPADTQPPRRRLHPERPQPGPSGRPPEPFGGGVVVVGDRAHHPPGVLGDQHPAVAGAAVDVEDLGQVAPEDGRRQRRGVLLVGGQQHPPDGRQVGPAGVADLDAGEAECR